MKNQKNIAIFNQSKIRRHWDDKKELWYFSVTDVIAILTESSTPKRYWTDLKRKLNQEGSQVYEKIVHLKLKAKLAKKLSLAKTPQFEITNRTHKQKHHLMLDRNSSTQYKKSLFVIPSVKLF